MNKCLWAFCLVFLHPAFSQERTKKPLTATVMSELLVPAVQVVEKPEEPELKRMSPRMTQIAGGLKVWTVGELKRRDVKAELPRDFEEGKVLQLGDSLTKFVVKPESIETRVMDTSRVFELPGAVVGLGQGSPTAWDEGGDGLELLHLTFLASPMPAVWDFEKERYLTKVTFGLKSSKGAQGHLRLEEPVEIKVAFDGLAGEEPKPMLLEGIGLDSEKSFSLAFKPTTEHPKLLVRSTISDVDLELRAVSRLSLHPITEKVLGFGLEEAVFLVSNVKPHGAPVENTVEIPVAVSVSGRGIVDPERPVFGAGMAQTQFKVRSSGLGAMRVEARVGDAVAVASVEQTFPLGALIAVLCGGALGGFCRKFVKGARSGKVLRWIVEGLAVSVVAFVAGVLGVAGLGLPSALVGTEAGALLVGVVSGFAGVVTLEKITNILGKG